MHEKVVLLGAGPLLFFQPAPGLARSVVVEGFDGLFSPSRPLLHGVPYTMSKTWTKRESLGVLVALGASAQLAAQGVTSRADGN